MPIVFAENFQNDNDVSIVQRYQGSLRSGTTAITKAWPLRQGASADPTGDTVLALPIAEYTNRLEIVFTLEFDGSATTPATTASLFLLGGIELVSVSSGVSVRINNNVTYPIDVNRTASGVAQQWNVVYDRVSKNLWIIINGTELALKVTLDEDPTWEPSIRFTCDTANGQAPTLNNTLTGLVVAYETTPRTFLSNIDFQDLALTVDNDGGWTFSDVGIIEDTSKDEGASEEPSITSSDNDLVLSVPSIADKFVNVYVAGREDGNDTILQVEGIADTTFDMLPEQTALPVISNSGTGSALIIRSFPFVPVGIGTAGKVGFGVGICPDEGWLTELGLTPLTGYDDFQSDNYGNYQHTNGGISVFIPKFYYRIGDMRSPYFAQYGLNCIDIADSSMFSSTAEANSNGYALHRAFIDDGKEKPGFFFDKYSASADGTDSCVSVPMANPLSLTTNTNYVRTQSMTGCTGRAMDSIVLSRARGYGWNVTSLFMVDAIAKISLAHGQAARADTYCAWYDANDLTNFPKGCNGILADHLDATVTFTRAEYASSPKAQTGSASILAKTTHNGQANGITDVNGGMSEVTIGVTQAGAGSTAGMNIESGDAFILLPTAKFADLTAGWNGATDAWGAEASLLTRYEKIEGLLAWGGTQGSIRHGNGDTQVFSDATGGIDYIKSCLTMPISSSSVSEVGTPLFGNDELNRHSRENLMVAVYGSWGMGESAGIFCRNYLMYRNTDSPVLGFRAAAYGS